MQCVHSENTRCLLFQALKMLPQFLHLAQFGVVHHKVITSVTEHRMVIIRIKTVLAINALILVQLTWEMYDIIHTRMYYNCCNPCTQNAAETSQFSFVQSVNNDPPQNAS